MANEYEVINALPNNFSMNGVQYENVNVLCYATEPANKKYLICGEPTQTLKCRKDDWIYILRQHNYKVEDLPQKRLNPVFDANGYVVDFTISDPETGEVL